MKPEEIKTKECADYILNCLVHQRPIIASNAFATRHFRKAYKLLKDRRLICRTYEEKPVRWQLSKFGKWRLNAGSLLLFSPHAVPRQTA